MCGITGFIDFNKVSSLENLKQMSNTLLHRGPDDEGCTLIKEEKAIIGLGHRRLAVIDLSDSGKQPMRLGDLHIVFNGEIYNYQELKVELQALNHSFKSDSDTEVILHAYQEWEEACLEKFIGMFSFVIYDAHNEEFFIARDRAGVKPFYYAFQQNTFYFGSELKAICKHPGFEKSIDLAALDLYLAYGNIPSPHTIYEKTYKLKPGHYLRFTLTHIKKGSAVKQEKYWDVYDAYLEPKLDISFEEAKKSTTQILKEAFNYRMIADVPVGIFLSGGYDSACLTSILQADASKPLETFTIGVPDLGLNEAPQAKEISKLLGTNHNEYYCNEKEAIELIPALPQYYDEPFADSSAIPTMLVSLMARKKVTVALSADGGDEIFAGYNRYEMMLKYGEKLKKIPSFVSKGMAITMDAVPFYKFPVINKKYNIAHRYEKVKSILRNPDQKNLMMSLTELYTEKQRLQLLKTHRFSQHNSAYDDSRLIQSSILEYMQAIDYSTYLPDDILTKVDRASMSASLESREPFLDHNIIEWAAQLPNDFKLKDGNKKFILKEIVHDYLPKEIMDRPKMGFAIPIEKWLMNELRPILEEYLNEGRIEREGIFKWKEIEKLKQNFLKGKSELGVKIWYLIMFEMWYETNMK